MKEKIRELISAEKTAKQEVNNLLEELSQLEDAKLSKEDSIDLKCNKIALETELTFRQLMIQTLEDLL